MATRASQLSVTTLQANTGPVEASQLSITALYSITPITSPVQVSQLSLTVLARKIEVNRLLVPYPPTSTSFPYGG